MRVKQVFVHYKESDQLVGEFKHCPFCSTRLVLVESRHRLRPTCSSCGFVQHRNLARSAFLLWMEIEYSWENAVGVLAMRKKVIV